MKIIYKMLAIYSLIVIGFLAFVALPILDVSSVNYTWNAYTYTVGQFTLIPVTILSLWSLFKRA